MNREDKQAHRIVANSMNYHELTSMVSELIKEKHELSKYLNILDLKKYDIAIDIYEECIENIISKLTARNYSKLTH